MRGLGGGSVGIGECRGGGSAVLAGVVVCLVSLDLAAAIVLAEILLMPWTSAGGIDALSWTSC